MNILRCTISSMISAEPDAASRTVIATSPPLVRQASEHPIFISSNGTAATAGELMVLMASVPFGSAHDLPQFFSHPARMHGQRSLQSRDQDKSPRTCHRLL